VQEIRVLRPGERGICVALVSAQTPHGYEELSGSCVVVTCLIEAGCKATLDALNRRLPVWIDEVQNQGSSPARAEA